MRPSETASVGIFIKIDLFEVRLKSFFTREGVTSNQDNSLDVREHIHLPPVVEEGEVVEEGGEGADCGDDVGVGGPF